MGKNKTNMRVQSPGKKKKSNVHENRLKHACCTGGLDVSSANPPRKRLQHATTASIPQDRSAGERSKAEPPLLGKRLELVQFTLLDALREDKEGV